ncbi:hypothetical protein [Vibrio parahaemolyticus]|uniref:hypothetical protein n=1 Tax=Vibrio parahaemolyticus TaxID=670 RepID=UPI003B66F1FF
MKPSVMSSWLVAIFLVSSVCVSYLGVYHPLMRLNENQILYLFSTSAQVIAGIYGLTLTGFIFFRNELSREGLEDESLSDAVDALKERYSKLLLAVTVSSIFTVFICNFVISSNYSEGSLLSIVAINTGQVAFVLTILFVAYFVYDVVSPKRIEKASRLLQKEVEPEVKLEDKGSLEEFLQNFNSIEYILQKYGSAFQAEINESNNYYSNKRRIPNPKLAEIIFRTEKIDQQLFDDIKMLIRLRNSIVHGAEPVVSKKMVETSKKIHKDLGKALGVHVPD